jgi:hypothetical protein
MVSCDTISAKCHRRNRCLSLAGWLAVLSLAYVLSIGPMVWLESRCTALRPTLEILRVTVYHPLHTGWLHGPKWLNTLLVRYTKQFEDSENSGFSTPLFGSEIHDWKHKYLRASKAREERWQRASPEERKAILKAESEWMCCFDEVDP